MAASSSGCAAWYAGWSIGNHITSCGFTSATVRNHGSAWPPLASSQRSAESAITGIEVHPGARPAHEVLVVPVPVGVAVEVHRRRGATGEVPLADVAGAVALAPELRADRGDRRVEAVVPREHRVVVDEVAGQVPARHHRGPRRRARRRVGPVVGQLDALGQEALTPRQPHRRRAATSARAPGRRRRRGCWGAVRPPPESGTRRPATAAGTRSSRSATAVAAEDRGDPEVVQPRRVAAVQVVAGVEAVQHHDRVVAELTERGHREPHRVDRPEAGVGDEHDLRRARRRRRGRPRRRRWRSVTAGRRPSPATRRRPPVRASAPRRAARPASGPVGRGRPPPSAAPSGPA